MSVRKIILYCGVLTAIDQGIKLIIYNFFYEKNVILIKDALMFKPVQNTHMTWLHSMFDAHTNKYVIIFVLVLLTAICTFILLYITYITETHQHLCCVLTSFFISGLLCLIIDIAFWGGSIDYIRLFDWFTFDLKDVYVKLVIPVPVLCTIKLLKLSKQEQKEKSFTNWLKKGCPMHRIK